MKKARVLSVLSLLCSLGFTSTCYGAPTVLRDASHHWRITGILDVDIGGRLYDVEYLSAPAPSIWPDITSATFWGNQAGAELAVESIASVLNNTFPMPHLFVDHVSWPYEVISDFFVIPYGYSGLDLPLNDVAVAAGGRSHSFSDPPYVWHRLLIPAFQTSNSTGEDSWITFTPSPTTPIPPNAVIPAPSALVLGVCGVVSLLGAKRRRHKHSRNL